MQNKLILVSIPAVFAAIVLAVASFASAQMCTMDAMLCPDGTYVGRSGPNCEFVCSGGNISGGSNGSVVVGSDGNVTADYNVSDGVHVEPPGAYYYDGDPVPLPPNPEPYPGEVCNGINVPCSNDNINFGANVSDDDYNGGGWYDYYTDPCTYTNWIWINPCYPDQGISADGSGSVNGGGSVMPDPTHGYGKSGFPGGDTSYEGGPSDVANVNADGQVNVDGSVVQAESSFSFSAFVRDLRSFFGF